MNTLKIAFVTLGCKLNYAETSTYERAFLAAGLQVVPWREKADVYLVNTCTVTETSNAKSRSIIRKLHRVNPAAAIVVTGCYAQLNREQIESIDGVRLVFGALEKSRVVSDTLRLLGLDGTETCGELEASEEIFPAYSSGERTRSFLKVQDGCDNFCAYCTVPFARGHSRNIPVIEAVRQAREIAAGGVKEIVLTGVNTGDFGRTTGESFLDLLKALEEVEGIGRYRISSIEPNLISEEIVDWIASGTKFLPHFHIPLQTGSDTLLKAMGRHYDTAFFADRIAYIRHALEAPGRQKVFFGIDTMVGLPGETVDLFEETCRFIESIRPAFIHIFPYSIRPGTKAAAMDGQVAEEEKARRVKVLESLCATLHEEFVQANRGLPSRVLFESRERGGTMSGYTENYIRIVRPYNPLLVGTVQNVTI